MKPIRYSDSSLKPNDLPWCNDSAWKGVARTYQGRAGLCDCDNRQCNAEKTKNMEPPAHKLSFRLWAEWTDRLSGSVDTPPPAPKTIMRLFQLQGYQDQHQLLRRLNANRCPVPTEACPDSYHQV